MAETAHAARVSFRAHVSGAVRRDFTNLYAIARRNSKVTARQFERFCRDIGASLAPAPEHRAPSLTARSEAPLIPLHFAIVAFVVSLTALHIGAHYSAHGVVNATQASLACFLVVNLMINLWEFVLHGQIEQASVAGVPVGP